MTSENYAIINYTGGREKPILGEAYFKLLNIIYTEKFK